MSEYSTNLKYDDVLTSILVNEKSIIGFLSAIFNFLARRTDFYCVIDGPYANIGFPPGVAEELVVKVLRAWDPKNRKPPNGTRESQSDINNEIMCSTVAQEVEVIADNEDEEADIVESNQDSNVAEETKPTNTGLEEQQITKDLIELKEPTILEDNSEKKSNIGLDGTNKFPEDYEPPVIPTQKNSETYNGAEREKYLWAQTIMDLDVIVKLPPYIKSSKDLKVTINAGDVCVACKDGDIIIKDKLPYKIKSIDSFWSISEGRLLMHLEKAQERWWYKFLEEEEAIDLSSIDCSRPLDELPEDHIAKVRELQWNQEQKRRGLPTSDEIRNIEVLKKAWNAPGSPFQGKEFDPSVLSQSSKDFTSFGS
ncbi:hypothetical protein K1T71_007081 [Dendrolimus kikuchii]|uniref:Uncharacterized protein n=1 Tax=Dendrolimus kikuchii TaxID=765133 RepID=A0ACC1D0M5_9NEOP|nr:hypothetical protein K1T71_007081 [Dendrolimus kikuchii]